VRAVLSAAFEGVDFAVRTHQRQRGTIVEARWEDGPSVRSVRKMLSGGILVTLRRGVSPVGAVALCERVLRSNPLLIPGSAAFALATQQALGTDQPAVTHRFVALGRILSSQCHRTVGLHGERGARQLLTGAGMLVAERLHLPDADVVAEVQRLAAQPSGPDGGPLREAS